MKPGKKIVIEIFGLNPDDYVSSISLSEECLHWIGMHIIDNDVYNIVEFGSGASTQFMIDVCEKHHLNVKIDSFDHTENYSDLFTYDNPNYNRIIRNPIECNDESKEKMFQEQKFIRSLFNQADGKIGWRRQNIFYDINPQADLKPIYDLAIIDGPNGNGRVFSYLMLKNIMSFDSYIVLDDSLHHDFMNRFDSVFKYEIIEERKDKDKNYLIAHFIP